MDSLDQSSSVSYTVFTELATPGAKMIDLTPYREINVLNVRPLLDIRRDHDWSAESTPELNMWRIDLHMLLAVQLHAAWKLKNELTADPTQATIDHQQS